MKYNFICFLIGTVLLALGSCNNEGKSVSQGTILGVDNRFCACCVGYLIVIDRVTYRFLESDLPKGSTILKGATYPLNVELRFEKEGDLCNDIDRISIQEMKKR